MPETLLLDLLSSHLLIGKNRETRSIWLEYLPAWLPLVWEVLSLALLVEVGLGEPF